MSKNGSSEVEELIRMQAGEAVRLHKIITDARPFEVFLSEQLPWLKENVFKPMEHDMIAEIKKLDFVPNSIAQVAFINGQLISMDRVESRIRGRVQEAQDARAKLDEIENSTPSQG